MVRLKRIPQRLRDIKDFVDEYVDFSDEPIEGLVPVGDTGLYRTPDEPADPTDCDRYPDSPFCGGNPFTLTPVGLEPTIIIGDCDIGVTLSPVLGFVKLPPVSLIYRKPECRNPSSDTIDETPKDDFIEIPPNPCKALEPASIVVYPAVGIGIVDFYSQPSDYFEGSYKQNLPAYQHYTKVTHTAEVINFEFPYRGIDNNSLEAQERLGRTLTSLTFKITHKGEANAETQAIYNLSVQNQDPNLTPQLKPKNLNYEYSFIINIRIPAKFSNFNVFQSFFDLSGVQFDEKQGFDLISKDSDAQHDEEYLFGGFVYQSAYDLILSDLSQIKNIFTPGIVTDDFGKSRGYYSFSLNYKTSIKCLKFAPPPPKEICCMPQCCPPPDDTLLKLLIKKVKKLSEAIGVDELPAALPKRIIYPNGKGEEKLKNLVEILGYQVKQIDRAVGLLPQKIKVADTNPGLAGNQSVEVEIHSFADFAKEILQLLLDTEGDVDTTNNMLVRVLYELGFIHQGVVQGDAMLDAIVEFLDFKQKWKKISIPFAFDPHAGTKGKVGQGFDKQKNTSGDGPQTEEEVEKLLPALLQNTEVDIRILINDEKKSLSDILNDIKRDTAIAAAAVSENADSGKLDQLVAAAQLLLQLEGAIDRKNIRQALTSGNLRTAKNNGT